MGVQYEASDEYVSYEVKSSKEIIEVLPLPPNAPENFIGAIGNYNFTRNFDLQEVKQGDVVVMTVVVEGEGNIHNISVPQFELPDGVIQYGDPEITESISYKQIGAKGRKVYKFHLQFLEKGNFTIPQMEISFFNPNEKKYVLLKSEAVAVHVLKSAQFQNQILDNSEGLITKLDSNNADNSDERKGETSTFSLVLLGVFVPIGLGAFLFFFIKRKPKKEIEKTVETMEEMKEVEHITILLEESNHFQLKGDYKVSFEQLETAIRMMVMFATEYLEDLPNRESINQELSELSVACETARFLEVYDAEKVRNVYSKANLIFKSLKQQMI